MTAHHWSVVTIQSNYWLLNPAHPMFPAPAATHPFATSFWDTALLILITLAFTGTFVWLWWRSQKFEPEMEDDEIGE